MTGRLASLADIAYRRRGRMVLAWIAAAVVIIGVGSSLAGDYNADYNTPGSESKASSDLTKKRFDGYSGQEIYVVWKDRGGARSPGAQRQLNAFFSDAEKIDHAADDRPRVGLHEGPGQAAHRRGRAERRQRPGAQARWRPDLRGAEPV